MESGFYSYIRDFNNLGSSGNAHGFEFNPLAPGVPDTADDAGYAGKAHTSVRHVHTDEYIEIRRIRLVNHIFVDCEHGVNPTETDTHYVCYDWFKGRTDRPDKPGEQWDNYASNNVAVFNWSGTSQPIDIARGLDNKDHIAEGGNLFKRGKYYYIIYNYGHYAGEYILTYKKATTVEGLSRLVNTDERTLLSPVYKYGHCVRNFGHGSIFWHDYRYYMFVAIGTPYSGNLDAHVDANVNRRTALVELKFDDNCNMYILDEDRTKLNYI